MNNIKPYKVLVRITDEQIKSKNAKYLIEILSDLEKQDPEKVKASRGGVSLMLPDVSKNLDGYALWVMSLYMTYRNFGYFLDAESLALIKKGFLQEILWESEKVKEFNQEDRNMAYSYYCTSFATRLGVSIGYTESDMENYFNDIGISTCASKVKSEEANKKCLCNTPLCAKCLSINCEDKNCPTHTKDSKIAWRKNWEQVNGKSLQNL